ncbi:hypothetical protein OF83DRAFT_1080139 [Amylostereum chailletii]|nr:hypothetical protein OF83DRAFT_1080139 [Amylostereum chailletii]
MEASPIASFAPSPISLFLTPFMQSDLYNYYLDAASHQRRHLHKRAPTSTTTDNRTGLNASADLSLAGVDNSAKIWSIYLSHAEKFDRALVESWKGDMDGILFFSYLVCPHLSSFTKAGLFSAVITAFLVDSYKTLQPDNGQVSTELLRSLVLFQNASATSLNLATNTNPSTSTALCISILWFASLIFSLSCALAATLVQQWARTYLQGTEESSVPHERARLRTYLLRGVEKFGVGTVIEGIPMLLHAALFLFLAGLDVFLFNINHTLAIVVLALVSLCFLMYAALTGLPAIFYDCPYKTPLSSAFWHIKQATQYAYASFRHGVRATKPMRLSNKITREWSNKKHTIGAELDVIALRWTMGVLSDDNDMGEFIEALPDLIHAQEPHTDKIVEKVLFGTDMLGHHIARLLRSCTSNDAITASQSRRQESHITTCLQVVSLLARTYEVPALRSALRIPFVVQYFLPISRDILILQDHEAPAIAHLARHTRIIITWRAFVNYHTFLTDIKLLCGTSNQGHIPFHTGGRAMQSQLIRSELQACLSGAYLHRPLEDLLSATHDVRVSAIMRELFTDDLNEQLRELARMPAPGPLSGAFEELLSRVRRLLVLTKECFCVWYLRTAIALQKEEAERGIEGETANSTLAVISSHLGWSEQTRYDDDERLLALLDDIDNNKAENGQNSISADHDRHVLVQKYVEIHTT